MPTTSTGQYADFAKRYLNVRQENGSEWLALCPYHDDHNASFQFNVEKGLFICFSCGASGTIRSLERRFGVSHRSVGVGLDVVYGKLRDLRQPTAESSMSESELAAFNFPTDEWSARGLNATTTDQFQLGYDIVRDALTIPARSLSGDLLGVVFRYLDPDLNLKYRYPKRFHRRDHLFASWLVADLQDSSTIVLTEGAVDTMSNWQAGHPSLAIYGSMLSAEQIRQIRLLGVRNVTLAFDNDRAGREIVRRCLGWKKHLSGEWEKTENDLRKWFRVSRIDWSQVGPGVKDTNDLVKRKQTRKLNKLLADPIPIG